MPTSEVPTVPAFKAALLDALMEREALSGVQRELFWPAGAVQDEGIYLGMPQEAGAGSVRGEFRPASVTTGRQRLDEVSQVPIVCQAMLAAVTPDLNPETRVYELFTEVVGACQDDATVSESIQWTEAIAYEQFWTPFNSGWAQRLVAVITIRSRIV